MKLSKAVNRDRRKNNRRKMRINGKSVFTIRDMQIKRTNQIKRARLEKEGLADG